ncbi:THAP domain-containing protein [Pimephales promelas]|nr:THAP domain-containing protein [Pimephales promelas]
MQKTKPHSHCICLTISSRCSADKSISAAVTASVGRQPRSPITTEREPSIASQCIKHKFYKQAFISLGYTSVNICKHSREKMPSCDFCGLDENIDGISFYKFPLQEEHRRQWLVNMRRDAERTPSESSSLCSAHFTPDCFESGSAHLHSDAIPTIFKFIESTNQILKDTENILPPHQGTSESTDSSRSPCCDCYKRLQATERNYQRKLAAAQQQIKEYKNNLMEESRKATQWQKRAIVLQSAIRAMKQRGSMIPATRKTSTPKTNDLN